MWLLICTLINALWCAAGFSGFVVFLWLSNYDAATWALVTGITSAFSTFLSWLRFKGSLYDWYSWNELKSIFSLGFVAFTAGVMGIIYYSTVEYLLKQPILPIDKSSAIPLIWAVITLKNGLVLMLLSRVSTDNEREPLVRNPHSYGNI